MALVTAGLADLGELVRRLDALGDCRRLKGD
jgi:hypothetical protein